MKSSHWIEEPVQKEEKRLDRYYNQGVQGHSRWGFLTSRAEMGIIETCCLIESQLLGKREDALL